MLHDGQNTRLSARGGWLGASGYRSIGQADKIRF
jgi:hypothetical protein